MKHIRTRKIIRIFVLTILTAMISSALSPTLNVTYAAGGTGLSVGDYLYMGSQNAVGYTGLPLWRVLDKDGEGNVLLLSEYLWTSENAEAFINFGEIAETGVPMEGYEELGYMSKGSEWQGSNAQAWCKGFESAVLSGVDGLTIREITKTDDEFRSPDATENTENAYIEFAKTKDILKNDKVFFLSAEEAARYMPTPAVRAARLHNGSGIGEYKDWWLRSPRLFTVSECAGKVFAYGSRRGMIGRQVVSSKGAARPAFWASASSNLSKYKCNIKYSWSSDNSKCTAAVCYGNRQLVSETVSSSSRVVKEPTQSEYGIKRFTASFVDSAFEEQSTQAQIAKKPAPTVAEKRDSKLPSLKKVKYKAGKKKVTIKWKKLSKKDQKKAKGIEIQIAADSGFKQVIKTTTASKKKASKVIKGLKSKKMYWVRVRTYKNAADGKHVSAWKSKKIKIK